MKKQLQLQKTPTTPFQDFITFATNTIGGFIHVFEFSDSMNAE